MGGQPPSRVRIPPSPFSSPHDPRPAAVLSGMRKIMLLAFVGAAFAPALSSPAPAAAFCVGTAVEPDVGCVNQVPCAAYSAVRQHASPYAKLPEMYCLM